MRKALFFLLIGLTACGGSLSDEQRRKLREASEQQAIVKVTEAEILDAAFAKGRTIMQSLANAKPDTALLAERESVKIHWLAAGKAHGATIEQQLIDAYLNSVLSGSPLADNVQKVGADSLLYTNPVVITRADSSIEVKGTWNIWISQQQLILSMNKK